MRAVAVFRGGILAGTLTEKSGPQFHFHYDDAYFQAPDLPPVSLTLPKTQQDYHSQFLFPFFFNMLSEGVNRKLQSSQWRIDEADSFGLLMATAHSDVWGAVTVKPLDDLAM